MILASLVTFATLLLAVVPPIVIPHASDPDRPVYPAPPGYLLPWPGGQIEDVTQGEETTFTHNATAAYAFDFGLVNDPIVATRSGRVLMAYDGSDLGGCTNAFAAAANYLVIDHGDGTSSLYLHLAYASVRVAVGDEVRQGQQVATSGATGLTCGGDNRGPGAHLHFQVQRTPADGSYFTQSLPIAFDDIAEDGGVPQEGRSYVSGNYAPGTPRKVKLTPHHEPRLFDPRAVAANPDFFEVPSPTPTTTATATAAATETPPPTPGATLVAETPTPPPTPTGEPAAEATEPPGVATATPEPEPTLADTPTPPPEPTSTPLPVDTPPPDPAPTAESVATTAG